jgi:argininosuccinate lyase
MANLWSGRFTKSMAEFTQDYNESLSFDHVLYSYSILGSLAHVTMLCKQDIIDEDTYKEIVKGLKIVKEKLDNNQVELDIANEDIMMLIEKELIDEIGDAGKALHTARSRNDQNALDETLFLRQAVVNTLEKLKDLLNVLLKKAREENHKIMPGFTHLQHAQPITCGYYYMAHFQGLKRDADKLLELYKRLSENPLGACAMAGTTLPTDRFITTELLGFDKPTENAMDTVANRDNFVEYLYIAALTMTHLSSFAEEITIFNSQEFSFIDIGDEFCTGSSIMPQKKNPDLAELARGKVGRTIGNLVNLLTVLKGTILTFNKDYQEDKEALFDSIHTLDRTIFVFARMIEASSFREDVLKAQVEKGFIEATDIAEFLVTKKIPFREAHKIVGGLVKYCENNNKSFKDINKEDLKKIDFPVDIEDLSQFKVEESIKERDSYGGTAFKEVERQIEYGQKVVDELDEKLEKINKKLNKVYTQFD